DIPILDFGGNFGRKAAGVEQRRRPDAASSFAQSFPDCGYIMPHRVDHSDPGYNNSATHEKGKLQDERAYPKRGLPLSGEAKNVMKSTRLPRVRPLFG